MIPIPDPTGLEFVTWGNLVAEQLAVYGVDSPVDEASWTDWANSLLNVPQLVSFPEPYGFSDWRQWAMRVLETPI